MTKEIIALIFVVFSMIVVAILTILEIKNFTLLFTENKKQIPKKPTPSVVKSEKIKIGNANWCKGTTVYKCPNCNEYISKIYDYCYKCGQALLWEGEE